MTRLALLLITLLASPIQFIQITEQFTLTLEQALKRNMTIREIVEEVRRLDRLEDEKYQMEQLRQKEASGDVFWFFDVEQEQVFNKSS